MGFDWHEVYAEAYRMSSGMCEAVTERMFFLAGQPACCPRGHPIPEADGSIKEMLDYPLHQVAMKTNLVITRILTCDSERLKYIGALQLLPGTQLQVIQIAPFNGPLQLKLNDTYRIIGHHVADLICACTLTDEGEALVPT
jgi:DtxR family Mn-dependent transcriptional regulator